MRVLQVGLVALMMLLFLGTAIADDCCCEYRVDIEYRVDTDWCHGDGGVKKSEYKIMILCYNEEYNSVSSYSSCCGEWIGNIRGGSQNPIVRERIKDDFCNTCPEGFEPRIFFVENDDFWKREDYLNRSSSCWWCDDIRGISDEIHCHESVQTMEWGYGDCIDADIWSFPSNPNCEEW